MTPFGSSVALAPNRTVIQSLGTVVEMALRGAIHGSAARCTISADASFTRCRRRGGGGRVARCRDNRNTNRFILSFFSVIGIGLFKFEGERAGQMVSN